jgi:hypothetical protein
MGLCFLHSEPNTVPDRWMLEHLRRFHPEVYGTGPDRWPDGGLVVYDQTIQPQDLQELDP